MAAQCSQTYQYDDSSSLHSIFIPSEPSCTSCLDCEFGANDWGDAASALSFEKALRLVKCFTTQQLQLEEFFRRKRSFDLPSQTGQCNGARFEI